VEILIDLYAVFIIKVVSYVLWVAANKEATEPRVPNGHVEVIITSKM
jgi:hypothetical protein